MEWALETIHGKEWMNTERQHKVTKSFLVQYTKAQLIILQNFNIQTCFGQFFWVFRLKCWFKGQMISRTHLSLPNAYKLMCFDRNINGNWDVKFFEWDYWSLHWRKNLTLAWIWTHNSCCWPMQLLIFTTNTRAWAN